MRVKSILAALLLMVAGLQTVWAQKVVLHKTNGQTIEHEYVDLGLPSGTLWATCNIGANSPEEYGDYFAWGETSGYNGGKTCFNWETYKYTLTYHELDGTVKKYCTKSSASGVVDNKTELEPEDDAATVNWGSEWQMPSNAQLEELVNSSYTTTSWTTLNGVSGRMIISKSNGKRIFLPAAGFRLGITYIADGEYGGCWSRSLYEANSEDSHLLFFSSSKIITGYYYRVHGYSVRPVRSKKIRVPLR